MHIPALAKFLVIVGGATSVCAWAITNPPDAEPGTSLVPALPAHMPEDLRASIRKVVVLPGASPAGQAVTGDYENETKGFGVGAAEGSEIGKGIQTEVGGIPVGFPFPILTLPGAIVGGLSGLTKREIQEFRDGLTRDLAEAASQPLTNDAIASDVFWGLRKLPTVEPKLLSLTTPIPADMDAVLYVSLTDITINVQGKEAIITTSANATLRRLSDGADVYRTDVRYEDRDTLSNWNEDDHALWHDYVNYAKHYLGREIAAEVFDRVELHHDLRPQKTKSIKPIKKNEWAGISKTSTPTLAWELKLLGGDSYGPWVNAIDPSDVSYVVEVYDTDRLVYAAGPLTGASHTIEKELAPCKTYRWSVRPSYQVGSSVKYGEWMRSNSGADTENGKSGLAASIAPAYIYDFASLEIKCRRR